MSATTLILFDIDGTLLRTGGAGKIALNETFEDHFGISGAYDDVTFVGSMDSALFRDAARKHLQREFTPEEETRFIESYVSALKEGFSRYPFQVFEGAEETLEHLQSKPNVVLGLATGNLREAALAKLNHAGLQEYFAFGGFGLDGPTRSHMTQKAFERGCERIGKPPDEVPVVLIGDSIYDIRCAHEIGAFSIGVLTGWTDAETLEAEETHLIASGLPEIDWEKVIHLANR